MDSKHSAKKPTIADVAALAGVSVAAVSQVISGKGRISSWTAQIVKDAINELGYVRNHNASTLRSGKTNLIGIVLHNISDNFCAELLDGVSGELEANGKIPLFIQYGNDGASLENRIDLFLHLNVDGIILITPYDVSDDLYIRLSNTPTAYISRNCHYNKKHHIGPNYFNAVETATEHLIKHGHRNIAFIGGEKDSYSRAERIGGFFSALISYDVIPHNEWIIDCPNNQRIAAEKTSNLLTHNPQITAILAYDEMTANGAIHGIQQAGKSVGKDNYIARQIALLCLENIPDTAITNLTCIDFSLKEIGMRAAQDLIQQLESHPGQPNNTVPKLILRDSA